MFDTVTRPWGRGSRGAGSAEEAKASRIPVVVASIQIVPILVIGVAFDWLHHIGLVTRFWFADTPRIGNTPIVSPNRIVGRIGKSSVL
jgi:hypothetical protein